MSGDLPSIKRRRISAHASTTGATGKDGTTPTSGGSGSIHERKRRWGKQRSNSSSAANISSDVLKVRRGEREMEREREGERERGERGERDRDRKRDEREGDICMPLSIMVELCSLCPTLPIAVSLLLKLGHHSC